MIDEEATRALRAMRARRLVLEARREGPSHEPFRTDMAWRRCADYWSLADWQDVWQKVRYAVEDVSRTNEEGGPPTGFLPRVHLEPDVMPDNQTHLPWEDYRPKKRGGRGGRRPQ